MESYIRKYFFSALLVAALALGVYILWPFLQLIVLAAALAIVFYPVCRKLTRWLHSRGAAAALTVVLFGIILLGPVVGVASSIFSQSERLYTWLVDHQTTVFTGKAAVLASKFAFVDTTNVKAGVATLTSHFTGSVGTLLTATASTMFSFLLVILAMFYFLKDGPQWKRTLMNLSPLTAKSDHIIIDRLVDAINGIIKGRLLVGVAQGILMGLGLFIFGVPNALLWGTITIVASLIPTIGTGLVALPAVIYLFAVGHDGAAIGLTLWGLLLVGMIDNVLNPYLVSRAVAIHPLLILLSILGGAAMLGPLGILTGPLVISFIYALMAVYKDESSSVHA